MDRFEDATGLKLIWEGSLKEDLPPMPRFLNRLLALPIAEQNELFAELETRIEANIEQAIEAGTHEQGVEIDPGRLTQCGIARRRFTFMKPRAPPPSLSRSSAATGWCR